MSEEEKEKEEKTPFKVISAETSVKLPKEAKEEDEAVQELLKILKPKIEAPKPISAKPIAISPKVTKPFKIPTTSKPEVSTPQITPASQDDSEIIVPDEEEGTEMSDDLLKMSEILKGIKEDEIAERVEETKVVEIDETSIIGIKIECPHCGRRVLLDRLEFLKQGYSDYCPYCNLMLLPNLLPEDYKPP